MREAAFRHAPLTVLSVHPVAVGGWTGNPIIVPEDAPEVGKARPAVEDAIANAAAELGRPGVEVTVQAVSGVPGETLIEASGDADPLVVGSRGISGFRRLPLGSVSRAVLHHARCPVVVVPDGR